MTEGVEKWISGWSPETRALIQPLRDLVRSAAPEAAERVATGWNILLYDAGGVFCYIQPGRGEVKLGFNYGKHLSDPRGLLSGGAKVMRNITFRSAAELSQPGVTDLLQAAVLYMVTRKQPPF